MKKILSILSIGTIATYSTISTVSCKETESNKITLDTTKFELCIATNAYDQIRQEIAKQANITMEDVKNTDSILIAIWKNGTDIGLKDGDIPESGVKYDVKVSVINNEYINNLGINTQEVTASKIDISNKTFEPLGFSNNNEEVYVKVRTQVALWTNDPSYTEANVASDPTITVEIYSGNELEPDSFSQLTISNGANIHITVTDSNNYFSEITKNDYVLTINT